MSSKDIIIAAAGGGQTTTAIQYVGGKTVTITPSTASNTTISLTDLTGSPDPTLLPGDIVIVSYTISSDGSTYRNPNVTSNTYTPIVTLFSNDIIETSLYSGYKLMGATPDSSVTVTPTTAAQRGGCVAIQAFRYVDETFPLQAPANTVTTINTVRPTPPTITPWDNDSVAVIVGAGAHIRGNVAYTTTGLTSFITTGSTDTDNDASIGAGFRVIQSGSYSPSQFGFPQTDSTSFSCAALSAALKPKPDTIIPSFVSYRAAGSATGGTITLTKPTGVQEGDFLFLTVACQTYPVTFTPPSGFTLVTAYPGSATYSVQTAIYKKIATASEPASYAVSVSTNNDFSSVMSVFRGANTVNTIGSWGLDVGSSPIAPPITPTRGGLCLAIFLNEAPTTTTSGPEDTSLVFNFSGSGSVECAQGIWSTVVAPYVPTVDREITNSGSHDSVAIQIQLTNE
jgi:hypothetical protein